ncbi:MAG: NTP transferase domain-containing protein [Proteobacteria bacterium]|nr:NTP transferase domain-containing protein [Pseudomonadota bacterium]MBU1419124.1 NTP transferase domain-containing protein [Pseudomonadota bacterium]MBU1455980.1 NTP transferase domain-containing protein [Pseudomonadota bacterium]
MQAMILAAGFGTRLLPYTKICPKPLFPLLNEPLLLLTVRRLQAAGFDHIIVNCHYLREQIVSALIGIDGVVVQQEETVLGTGGGLRMALSLMREQPLLVTNGDIYHTVDYRELYHAHDPGRAAVTMAMHDHPRFNKVTVRGDQVIGFDGGNSSDLLAFTGLHVLEPEVLERIPLNLEYSIIDCYRELLEAGESIRALHVDGSFWTDMGTVEDYLSLHGRLLRKEIPRWKEFSMLPHAPFLVHDVALKGERVELLDWACVGRAQLEKDVTLRRCVVWDGVRVAEGTKCTDSLLVP